MPVSNGRRNKAQRDSTPLQAAQSGSRRNLPYLNGRIGQRVIRVESHAEMTRHQIGIVGRKMQGYRVVGRNAQEARTADEPRGRASCAIVVHFSHGQLLWGALGSGAHGGGSWFNARSSW